MKQRLGSLSIFIAMMLALSFVASVYSKSLMKEQAQNTAKANLMSRQQKEIIQLWSKLFNAPRGTGCVIVADGSNASVSSKNGSTEKSGQDSTGGSLQSKQSGWGFERPSFKWIKKWGFGPVAYLIDFFDPVFQNDFIIEANQILKDFSRISKEETDESLDPFKLSDIAPKNNKLLTDNDYKDLNPNFSKAVYDNSINAVQLRKAFDDWSWSPTDSADAAYELIVKYDINGDGRLNAEEIVLASIWNNKKRDDLICYNCFFLLARKLGAMFQFLDCQNKGYLQAEELWLKLPTLIRKDKSWNIFKKGNSDTIRTNAVNDFILKNSYSMDGAINKNEFVNGVLLAYWQRQTSPEGVINGNTKSLKEYRWINKTIDRIAEKLDP